MATSGGQLLEIGPQPAEDIRHTGDRPVIGVEQGSADQFGVIGVDDDVIFNSGEAGALDRNTAVARAISQLVEQGDDLAARRAGENAEQAVIA